MMLSNADVRNGSVASGGNGSNLVTAGLGGKRPLPRTAFPWHLSAMRIVKDKLSKGFGYPLKPSALQAAMEAAKVQTKATLFQHNSAFWRNCPLFDASFSPPGQLVDNQEEVLWIGCRAVPGNVCNAARSTLQDDIIPSFIEWIKGLEALPQNSPIRREKQKFERDWQPPEDLSADLA